MHCAVLRPAVCHVHFLCMCVLVSNICEMKWTIIAARGIFLCVVVICCLSTSWLKPCLMVVMGAIHALSFARLISHSHTSVHKLSLILHWWCYVSLALPVSLGWHCDYVCKCEASFCSLACVSFGVKTRLPVLFVLVEFSRISCFVIFWVKIQ